MKGYASYILWCLFKENPYQVIAAESELKKENMK